MHCRECVRSKVDIKSPGQDVKKDCGRVLIRVGSREVGPENNQAFLGVKTLEASKAGLDAGQTLVNFAGT